LAAVKPRLTRKRVLVVDTDLVFVAGVGHVLRAQPDWEAVVATDVRGAVAALRAGAFDAVVATLRLREPGGLPLLELVKRDQPAAARLGLVARADGPAVVEALAGAAHRLITKPCLPEVVGHTLGRALALHRLVGDEGLRGFIAGLSGLPPVPHVYAQLTAAIADPDASLPMIARIVEQDLAIAVKLLQVANSAHLGSRERVSSVERAVMMLGLETVRSLALSTHLLALAERAPVPGFSLAQLQRHALLSARIARRLAPGPEAQLAFTAGLLADVGKMVLAICLPERFAEIVRACQAGAPVLQAERAAVGFGHPEIGAYVLGLWGLPTSIVEAVAFHHAPAAVPNRAFDALAAVHAAAVLADQSGPPVTAVSSLPAELDATLVTALSLGEKVAGWKRLAAEEAAA
jgi:HD-like signal output (HDOD) protein/ActR/RegA family two-component response regulator